MTSKPNLMFKSSDIGTWSWDIVENSMTWDNYSHRLFGLDAGGLPTRYEDFLRLLRPEDQDRVGREILESMEKRVPYETEFSVVWPNGSIHVLGARGTVHRDEAGRPLRMIGICWNISDSRRTEESRDHLASLIEGADDAIIGKTLDGIIVSWNK